MTSTETNYLAARDHQPGEPPKCTSCGKPKKPRPGRGLKTWYWRCDPCANAKQRESYQATRAKGLSDTGVPLDAAPQTPQGRAAQEAIREKHRHPSRPLVNEYRRIWERLAGKVATR